MVKSGAVKPTGRPRHKLTREDARKGGQRSRHNQKPPPKQASSPTAQAFREFWRDWLLSPAVVKYIKKAALCWTEDEDGNRVPAPSSVTLLGKVIDKVHATPQSIRLTETDSRPMRIFIGESGQEIDLPYLPKGNGHAAVLVQNKNGNDVVN